MSVRPLAPPSFSQSSPGPCSALYSALPTRHTLFDLGWPLAPPTSRHRPAPPGGPRSFAGGPRLSLRFASRPWRRCAGCEAPATQKHSGAGGAVGLCSYAMAASAWCCLRCCRDGGTGHIPLKEMPAVQLDTQHMGKGLPTGPNRPPRAEGNGAGTT